MLDDPESPPTGRTTATLEHARGGNMEALARELAELRTSLEVGRAADAAARAQEAAATERRATWWRWAGGIAASAALTMGGGALRLAATAAADHDVVARHELVLSQRSDQETRLLEQSARTAATLEEMRTALVELRADVREIRAEGRRTDTRGDRR